MQLFDSRENVEAECQRLEQEFANGSRPERLIALTIDHVRISGPISDNDSAYRRYHSLVTELRAARG